MIFLGDFMVYYVGYYNCDLIRNEERVVAAASENKMNYISASLSEAIDGQVEIISPAETKLNKIVRGKKHTISECLTLKTFMSFSSEYKIFRALGHICTRILFVFYVLINVKPDDTVVVYHSLAYMNTFMILKRIKKFQLIIEVEELYADVTDSERLLRKEIKYLQIADKYIFITELVRNRVNMDKEYVVSHGTYKSVSDFGFKFEDNYIHVVYAGTFRKAKGGVYTAIEAAEFLDDNYVLEVLGSGSEEENAAVRDLIFQVSQKTECKLNYVGFKTGEDFNKYIQACHIGLSTQPIDAKFNETSFPSKVLMYMSNGLKVVSVRIPAVETSVIGKYVYYYDCQNAESVAYAIKMASANKNYNYRVILDEIHNKFVSELRVILDR